MKKFLLSFFVLLSLSAISQSNSKDELKNYYSEEYLINLKSDSPEEYNFLVYAFNNACYIVDFPDEKSAKITKTLDIKDMANINFLSLGLEIQENNQYYRINGTDKMLVLKSIWILNQEINKL